MPNTVKRRYGDTLLESIESAAKGFIDQGFSSDDIATALEEMKEYYGDALSGILVSSDGQFKNDSLSNWLSFPDHAPLFALQDWLGTENATFLFELNEELLRSGETVEDINKSYSLLWKSFESGVSTVEGFKNAMQDTGEEGWNLVDAYTTYMGKVNGVVETLEEHNSRVSDIQDEWDKHIKNIENGATADAKKAFTDQIDELAHLEG